MEIIREEQVISKEYSQLTKKQRFQADGLHLVCSIWHEGHLLNVTHLCIHRRHLLTHSQHQ